MPALRDFARGQLAVADERSLRRRLVETERIGSGRVRRGDREYVSFSCNDYLGLSHHPAVIAAARAAVERYGAGAGASRLVTGTHPLYGELESLLAEMKGAERALVFGSGYLANAGTIPALVGKGDLIVADRLCHACAWDGARLSGATLVRFDHNDANHCGHLLDSHRGAYERCLILTETVFSMDGDLGPIEELGGLARDFDAWLMTDDAHGFGVVRPRPADVQMGTLSKAVGGVGGYVCGPAELIGWLENRARSLMFSTGLPPASVAAAAAALRIIRGDAGLRARPLENARRFTAALGWPPAQSPIVPVFLGEPRRALEASAMLERQRLARRGDPPAVGPGRDGPAPVRLLGDARTRAHRTGRGPAEAASLCLIERRDRDDRVVHHRRGHGSRQDPGGGDPLPSTEGPRAERCRPQAGRLGLSRRRSRERPRAPAAEPGPRPHGGRGRRDFSVALRDPGLAAPGGPARERPCLARADRAILPQARGRSRYDPVDRRSGGRDVADRERRDVPRSGRTARRTGHPCDWHLPGRARAILSPPWSR